MRALGRSFSVGSSTDSPPTPESKKRRGAFASTLRHCEKHSVEAIRSPRSWIASLRSQCRKFVLRMRMARDMLLALALGYLLGSIPFGLLLTLTTRISSASGMTAAISAPVMALILNSYYFPMLLGFAVLVLWKHRENILRLAKGTEPRIGMTTSSTA